MPARKRCVPGLGHASPHLMPLKHTYYRRALTDPRRAAAMEMTRTRTVAAACALLAVGLLVFAWAGEYLFDDGLLC